MQLLSTRFRRDEKEDVFCTQQRNKSKVFLIVFHLRTLRWGMLGITPSACPKLVLLRISPRPPGE